MKIIKATPIIALVVVMALALVPATPNEGTTDAVLSAGQIEGDVGSEVIIPVSLAGNTGFASAEFQIGYDADVLEYKNSTVGTEYGEQFLTIFKVTPSGTGESAVLKYSLLMEDPDDTLRVEDITGDGILLNVTFTVLSSDKGACSITPDIGTRGYFADKNDDDMGVTCIAGSFTIPTYDIVFKNGTQEVSKQTLRKGEVIVKPAEVPVKADDVGYTYQFSAWEGFTEGMTVSGDATFNAVFDSIAKTYNVTWMVEGKPLTVPMKYGDVISAPEAPVKDPSVSTVYTFKSWSGFTAGMTVSGDVTFTAVFEEDVRTYQILFKNGAKILQDTSFAFGEMPVYSGETPVKESDKQYDYRFVGWGDIVEVTGPATYEAVFSGTIRTYDVTWVVGNDSNTVPMEYGATIVAPADPVKETTVSTVYTFKSWSGFTAGMTVSGDVTFTAVFDETPRMYKITFMSEGSVYKESEQAYGSEIVLPSPNPAKESDKVNNYAFTGWDGYTAGMKVSGEAIFTAKFKAEAVVYDVLYYVDGKKYAEQHYGYDDSIVLPAAPAKDSTVDKDFAFVKWEGYTAGMKVTEDLRFDAVFSDSTRVYDVTWVVGNDSNTVPMEYGAVITAPKAPVKDPSVSTVYTFKAWFGFTEGMTVSGDVTFTAVFDETPRMYKITFMSEGSVYEQSEQAYGSEISIPLSSPRKDSDGANHYVFAGWEGYTSGMKVSGEATFTAKFKSEAVVYDVLYYVDGEKYAEQNYGFNDSIVLPATPVKDSTVDKEFKFVKWEGYTSGMKVTEDLRFDAVFTESKRMYDVTWVVGDDSDTVSLEYGATIVAPADPVKATTVSTVYTFREWSGFTEGMTVKEDVTFTAVFDEAVRMYKITFMSEGSVYKESEQAYGTRIVLPSPNPVKESDKVNNYAFTGWDGYTAGMKVEGEKTFTAKFKSEAVVYDVLYYVDGKKYAEQNYGFNDSIVLPAAPAKDSTVDKVFSFDKWEGYTAGMKVTEDLRFDAVFTESKRMYQITFMQGEEVIQAYMIPYGETPVYTGKAPVKESDQQYTYTFIGWGEVVPVTGDAVYQAVFDSVLNEYDVTWVVNDDRTVQTLPYGTPIVAPADPVVEGSEFHGWDGFVMGTVVTGDVTFTAKFGEGVRYHTVTFMNGDVEVKSEVMKYGDRIVAPAGPVKESTDLIVYTFSHWNGYTDGMTVGSDIVFQAVFTESARTYKLVFDTAGGNEIPALELVPGTAITAPEDPVRKEFAFTGWSPAIPAEMPVGDITVTTTWYWVGDKTEDKDIGKKHEVDAGENNRIDEGTKETIENAEKGDVISVKPAEKEVEVVKGVVDSMADSGVGLEVVVEEVTVRYPSKVFENLKGSDIKVKVEKSPEMNKNQKDKVGDRYSLSLKVVSGEDEMHQLGAVVTVSIEYTLRDGQTAENIVVFYVDDQGNVSKMPTKYDPYSKILYFDTNHHSVFYVGHEDASPDYTMWIVVGVVAIIVVAAVVVYMRRS